MTILKDEFAVRQQNDLLRRMKQAKLPRNCDLDDFDFNHSAGITKSQLHQLRVRWNSNESNAMMFSLVRKKPRRWAGLSSENDMLDGDFYSECST